MAKFSQRRLFYILAGILFLYGEVNAVVIGGDREGCGGALTGNSGNITSPGYPLKYPENILCSWNITVDEKFRIQIEFLDFEIEAAVGCLYDYVLLRDGLTVNSPVLGKVCHVNPQSILSTGSSVLVQFYSDMSEVKRGFYIKWRTVPKVPLLLPNGMSVSSPWLAIPTPKNLAQIDGGISESLWGTDFNNNVYIYSNNKWDLVDGRMVHVTSGESVFGISSNGDVWYRQGVLLENPKGFGWEKIRIDKPMKRIESGRKGIAIVLDPQGNVYQFQMKDSGPTSVYWRLISADSQDPLVDLSCGSYACWFVSKNGNVFIAKNIDTEAPKAGSVDSVLQNVPGVQMKKVAAGFGESVWGITNSGAVYKRVGVNALSPEGSEWQLVKNVAFNEITVGLTGVYGLTNNGILITVEELKCGGIVHEKKGRFSTPKYPDRYPRGLTCLWIIRVPDAKGIALTFNGPVGIDKLPRCHDYVLTFEDGKYPSKSEPIIECGTRIDEKFFNDNEVWVEFRSPGQDGGMGFQATYSAWFDAAVTPSPTKQPVPKDWEVVKARTRMLLVSANIKDDTWALDGSGRPYVHSDNDWRPVSQEVFKSLAVGLTGVWGVTEKGQILYRQGVTSQDKTGLNWVNVDGDDITRILTGPMDEIIGIKRDGSLVWRFGVSQKSPTGTEWIDLGKRVFDASVGTYGLWIIDRSGNLQFGAGEFDENNRNTVFKWTPVTGKFKKIRAGYGGSLWGVLLDGKVAKRRDVNSLQPTGTEWLVSDSFTTNDISPGMLYVYRTRPDGTVLRKKDNTCGGVLSRIQGEFQSPNYPSAYPKNTRCLWRIQVPEAKQIKLNFQDFNLEYDQYCRKDRLLTYSPGTTEPVIECGGNVVAKQVDGNTLSVEFISDQQREGRGFKANYRALFEKDLRTTSLPTTVKTTTAPTTSKQRVTTTAPSRQGCGGSFYQEYGQFTSPNYPEKYENSLDCKWIITVNPGKTIQVLFADINIETDGQCGYDYIEIGNGAIVGENARSRLCGALLNQKFTSTGNQIWIRFFTDSGVQDQGFKAYWSTGEIVKTTKATTTATRKPTTPVTLPDFLPKGWSYASSASRPFYQVDTGITDYVWAIDSFGRPFIWLNEIWIPVTDRAFTQITSGGSGTWAVTGNGQVVFRGGDAGPSGSKWSDTGRTSFKMVDSGPFGFVAAIKSNNELVYRDGISRQSPLGTDWKNMGKSLESVSIGSYGIWGIDQNKNVHFTRRPAKLSGSSLSWRIIPGAKMKQIDAGYGDNVYAVSESGMLYKRMGITHDKPEGESWRYENAAIKSVTTGMKGLFGVANNNRIAYKRDLPTQCGGVLTANSGIIENPGFSLSYPQSAHCLWVIRVPSAKSIKIEVDSFDVFESQDCSSDYVLLHKRGFYSPENGVDKYCGKRTDLTRNVVDGGEVWVIFQASEKAYTKSSKGFRLRYSADVGSTSTRPTVPVTTTLRTAPSTILHVTTASNQGCGGSFIREYGSFSSPGFPNLYKNNLRCIWTITVQPDRVITLSFDDFAVEEDITCRFDYVLIRTSSQNGIELGKFCGSARPRDIEVNGNKVWILFKSDASETKRGFRVIWSSKRKAGNVFRTTAKPTTSYVQPKVYTTSKEKVNPTTAPQIPTGWSEIFSDIKFAHIDGGISPNAWAVDQQGNTFFQEGRNWRLVSGAPMKWVTSGGSGVWAIDAAGNTYYRRNIAPLTPMGAYWDQVTGPRLTRIDSGPDGVVMAVDENNMLLVRDGISSNNPKGSRWRNVGSGFKHLSVGTYGYWVIDLNNQAYFSPMSSLDPFARPRRTPVAGKFTQVKTGFGGSLWAVTPDGYLYRRRGITAITPTGQEWEKIGNLKVKGVTSGMSGVFTTVRGTDQLLTTPDRRCGDILTAATGTFNSPSYPLDYPPKTTCLWQIRVPNAKKIIVDFQSFNLEAEYGEDVRCNKDYLLFLEDGRFPSAYAVKKRCGTDASPLIFEGDRAWIEFVSDENNNFPGFSARYQAVFSPSPVTDRPVTRAKEQTTSTIIPTRIPTVYTECGGTIDASIESSGSFAHPGYPEAYRTYSSCRYLIRTSNNKRIRLTFDLFDLEEGQGCKYDYFQVNDGNSNEGNLLGKFCGKIKPSGIRSSGNSLYIEFVSDSSTVRPGFLAKWNTEDFNPITTRSPAEASTTKKVPEGPNVSEIRKQCGGNIDATTKSSGAFAHPSYPNQYRNQVECIYIINTTPERKITLTFEKFTLEATAGSSTRCSYDFVEIRDGSDANGKFVGKFCGDTKPGPFTSSGNALYVKFITDSSTTDLGFLAKWKTDIDNTVPTIAPSTACGGTLRGNKGSFASPGYPHNHQSDLDCVWLINVDSSKIIQLTFELFDLEQSDSCNYDFIEVFDGSTDTARRIGIYCNKMPNELRSSGNVMRVRFHSDKGRNYKGFLARWIAEEPSVPVTPSYTTKSKPCFQRISGIGGEIYRGGLSSNYQPNQDCIWIITVPRDKNIKLSFDYFDLEDSAYCSKDSLRILDGPNDISRTLGNYCGRKRIDDVVSSGNELFIRFKSDSENNKRGFQIRWTAVNARILTTVRPTTPAKTYGVDFCRGVISGQSGNIVTPNYPRNYPVDIFCTSTIQSAPGTRIVISFADFDLEPSVQCFGDVLAIRDGSAPSAPSLGEFCGSVAPPEIKSTGNAVYMQFISDSTRTGRGFAIRWRSERLPATVAPRITTKESFSSAPVCGGKLYGSRGRLQSPTLARNFPFGVTCIWVIETGKSSEVELRLSAFDSRSGSKDCSNSYLLLRDGMSSYGRKLTKLCNGDAGRRVQTTGNTLYIEYYTAAGFHDTSFDLTWNEVVVDSKKNFECGGVLTEPAGSIKSPSYPSNYGNNLLCTWNIMAPKGYKVYLRITQLDLEEDNGCTRDSLVIRDGHSSESTIVGRYCGRITPRPITSTSNAMFIEMKTDCKNRGFGFAATYQRIRDNGIPVTLGTTTKKHTTMPIVRKTKKTSTANNNANNQPTTQPTTQPTFPEGNVNSKGGLLTGISGVIRSPNFPKTYPAGQDIVWVIKGPANGRIALNFRAFDLEDDSGCQYDYVQLRDGPAADSPSIGRFCGRHIPATYTSANNALWVRFYTDNSDAGTGFEATWRWIRENNELPAQTIERTQNLPACGGTLNGKEGEVSSPQYPQYYPINSECIWIIRPKQYSVVSLQFKSINIEPESRCGYDFVEVRDGDSSTSPLLGRFCGSSIPDVQASTNGALWVRFKSDSSSNYRGFLASWKAGINGKRRRRRNVSKKIGQPVCGKALAGTNGTLDVSLPMKASLKFQPVFCQWTIKSHNKGTISLHIRDLAFNKLDSCDSNYMDIRVEHNGNFELLTRLCPSDKSNWYSGLSIPTGSRRVLVVYALERRLAHPPLRVMWTTMDSKDVFPTGFPLLGTSTGCEERLTKSYGSISTPNFPNNYGIKTACLWIITLDDAESIITLKFDSFDLESHAQCRYDYLLVRDGDSQASPIIGKYCGNSILKDIRSSTNRLWLRFYSDSVFTGKGFHAVYSQTKKSNVDLQKKTPVLSYPTNVSCGGQFSADSGHIQSPGYPSRYPSSTECIWIINSKDPQLSVSFSFESFALEDTPQCQFDFVQIEDISSSNMRVLGRFCGRKVPLNDFIGKKLRVTFKSDASSSDVGFKGQWKKVSSHRGSLENSACGGDENGVVGFIRSANYPENYRNNERCEWKISASQASMKIQLRFSNFNVEPSTDCEYDYIEVFDGDSRDYPSLGKFCGRHVPDMVESTRGEMFVVFNTDGSDTRPGFEIVWVAVYKHGETGVQSSGRKARVPDTISGSCGGLFQSDTGVIKTPNYPSNYPANALCTWIIKSSETSEIKLTFKSFDLEKHSECKYDSMVIKDGSEDTSKIIGRYCGDELPSQVRSSSSALWIQFKSDSSKQLKGFEASWQRVEKSGLAACGTRFTSLSGQITSPNYPLASTNRKFCTWIIDVPKALKIKLQFKDINMRSSSSCSYGYVQVFDGDTTVYPELGRFCHSFLPRPIISSGNKLLIGFQPDGSRSSRGFKAEWTSIQMPTVSPAEPSLPATKCGSTLTAESGNIILPQGVTSCTWLVRPSSGKRITLSVVKANLISNPACRKELLEIRNGFTSVAPLLLRICGRLQPKSVKSFTGVLRITYRSHDRSSNPHVNLYWTTSNGSSKKDIINQASCGIIRVPHQKNFLSDRALVTSGSLPWIAAILSGSSNINCGAAILSPKWAITAAHCFRRFPFNAFRKVMVGELNLLETEGTEQELKIKLVHIHPSYNAVTNENDIALINFDGTVTLNDKVNTICLPSNNTDFSPGTICTTAGWGTRRFLGKPSKPLVLARLPLVTAGMCNSTSAYRGNIKDGMLCAGRARGGLDTCQGDGGGPLTCEIRPGKQVLIGISSWGNGCASPYKYGVYTDVRKYLSWIESIIEL